MTKEESVQMRLQEMQAGVAQVQGDELGKAFDDGFGAGVASVPAPDPTEDVQAQIDAAVAAKVSELQPVMDSLKTQLDEMTAKEQAEEGVVAALQAKLDKITAILTG